MSALIDTLLSFPMHRDAVEKLADRGFIVGLQTALEHPEWAAAVIHRYSMLPCDPEEIVAFVNRHPVQITYRD